MTLSISPTQSEVMTALRSFLMTIIDPSVKIIAGQTNRVPQPKETEHIVMWPLNKLRLSTNIETFASASMLGFIEANQMIITQMLSGEIEIGQSIAAQDVSNNSIISGTVITDFLTGDGGAGSYLINNSQTFAGPHLLSFDNDVSTPTQLMIQLDVHGSASSDNAQIISNIFFSPYAVDQFAALNQAISPLYVSDPKQVPFINAEQQYETRWIVEVNLEVNQSIAIPQDFATAIEVDVISVEATYP